MKKLNTPSYSVLLSKEKQIRSIQELYENVGNIQGSVSDDASESNPLVDKDYVDEAIASIPAGPQGPMGPSGYSGAAEDLEVVQVSGDSVTAVMSQKAVSDLPFVMNGYNINEDGFNIADGERNVGLRYDNDGLDAGKLNPHFIELLKSEGVAVDCIASVEEDGLYVVDGTLNVGVKVDNDGIHAENVLEFLTINY